MNDETTSSGEGETRLAASGDEPDVQPQLSGIETDFLEYEGDGGTLEYRLFVPSGYEEGTPVPLVVLLHGCTQDPDTFAAGTRITDLAERETFLAALPKQSRASHFNRCRRWFEDKYTDRGRGEVAMIAGMTARSWSHIRSTGTGCSSGDSRPAGRWPSTLPSPTPTCSGRSASTRGCRTTRPTPRPRRAPSCGTASRTIPARRHRRRSIRGATTHGWCRSWSSTAPATSSSTRGTRPTPPSRRSGWRIS